MVVSQLKRRNLRMRQRSHPGQPQLQSSSSPLPPLPPLTPPLTINHSFIDSDDTLIHNLDDTKGEEFVEDKYRWWFTTTRRSYPNKKNRPFNQNNSLRLRTKGRTGNDNRNKHDTSAGSVGKEEKGQNMARGSYERLESGLTADGGKGKAAGGGMGKRFTWKRLAVGGVVFIGLVWFFGPRREGGGWHYGIGHTATDVVTATTQELDTHVLGVPTSTSTPHNTNDNGGSIYAETGSDSHKDDGVPHPDSYDTDPDPMSTTHCTQPYKSTLPLVQYALMIDAGSTGSRIHIYKFNNCGPTPDFEYEVFKMTQPGLSWYAKHGQSAEDAAKSLDELLDEAVRVVPESMRKCTPVAVKATAGLRLLPGTQSADIIHAVERRLVEVYPFKLIEEDGVVVMDGKDEGVYAWITVNYLMGTITEDAPRDAPTFAVLDLGGASTQIVFEPVFSRGEGDEEEKLEEGEHKYDLRFAGREHVLYQHSYLGYGLKQARMHVHRLVDFMDSVRANGGTGASLGKVGNPCLAKGMEKVVEVKDERSNEARNVTMVGEDVGSFEACSRLVQLVLAKDAVCELKPCSFDGVYQPSLLTSFPSGKVLLLSYFYDRLYPLLSHTISTSTTTGSHQQSQSPITVSTIAETARDVCEGRPRWESRWGNDAEAMEELEGRPEHCLDLTFMYTLLRLGYEFEDGREVMLGKKIRDTELGWCLGATIAVVGGGALTCRV